MIRPLRVLGVLGATLLWVGCTGAIDGTPGGANPPGATPPGGSSPPGVGDPNKPGVSTPSNPTAGALNDKATVPGTAPLRRLTLLEYRNTVRDLLGLDASTAVGTTGVAGDQDSALSGFVRGGTLTTGNDARAFMTSADDVAKAAITRIGSLLPCGSVPAAAADQDKCATDFINQFGSRAFRRPLSSKESEGLQNLYKAQRGAAIGATFEQAIGTLVSTMLQTPYFLYHWELGPHAPQKDGDLIRYNNYEIASKLSYLFWATMPDDNLFKAAKDGALTSPEQIANEARRMLKDEKAREAIRDFHLQWLEIGGLADQPKDTALTNYSPAVAASMAKETTAFVDSIFFGPKATGKLEVLLTSPSSFIDGNLAKVYGVAMTGTDLKEVTLPEAQRAGILLQGSFLATKADPETSHPIKRADTIIHRMLCMDLAPPPNLEIPPVADPNPNQTTRERYDVHGKADCAKACHNILDPIGFAFENYDAIGAFRATENGKPVDASGTVSLGSSTLTFNNGVEFVKQLAKLPEVSACVAKQYLRYTLRRKELSSEDPSVKVLEESFKESGYDLRELLVSLTKTRAFTHRALSAGEVAQ
jgi:hypothetical protein